MVIYEEIMDKHVTFLVIIYIILSALSLMTALGIFLLGGFIYSISDMFAFDVGVKWIPAYDFLGNRLSLGANVSNIGPIHK